MKHTNSLRSLVVLNFRQYISLNNRTGHIACIIALNQSVQNISKKPEVYGLTFLNQSTNEQSFAFHCYLPSCKEGKVLAVFQSKEAKKF